MSVMLTQLERLNYLKHSMDLTAVDAFPVSIFTQVSILISLTGLSDSSLINTIEEQTTASDDLLTK